jgi:hypothetical protein
MQKGCAKAQDASNWSLTMEIWVQYQAYPCGTCGGHYATGPCFSPSTSVFCSTYHSINAPYSFTHSFIHSFIHLKRYTVTEAIPLQAWTVPEDSRRLKLPDFKTNGHMKVVRLSVLRTGRLYSPENIPGTQFCWRLS